MKKLLLCSVLLLCACSNSNEIQSTYDDSISFNKKDQYSIKNILKQSKKLDQLSNEIDTLKEFQKIKIKSIEPNPKINKYTVIGYDISKNETHVVKTENMDFYTNKNIAKQLKPYHNYYVNIKLEKYKNDNGSRIANSNLIIFDVLHQTDDEYNSELKALKMKYVEEHKTLKVMKKAARNKDVLKQAEELNYDTKFLTEEEKSFLKHIHKKEK